MAHFIKRFLLTIIILTSSLLTAQKSEKSISEIQHKDQRNYGSEKAYNNIVNRYATGNVKETGNNSEKIINADLARIDKEVKSLEKPEGWDELLKQADTQIQKERVEKQKQDSIQNKLKIQTKAVLLEQQKANAFKNKMIGLLISLICLVIIYFIMRWLLIKVKKKSSSKSINLIKLTSTFKRLNQKEILTLSVTLGVVFLILSGSLFPKTKYYSLYKGQSVEVSKSMSTFELQEFNFSLSIIVFIVSFGLLYGTWYFKNKNAKI